MRLHKNHHVILAEEEPEEDNANRNIDGSAQLVQRLGDRSLSLVMRDAKDDGPTALQIPSNHYSTWEKVKHVFLTCTLNLPRCRKGTTSPLQVLVYVPRPLLHR